MDECNSCPSLENNAEIKSENRSAGEDQFFPKIQSLKTSPKNEKKWVESGTADSGHRWVLVLVQFNMCTNVCFRARVIQSVGNSRQALFWWKDRLYGICEQRLIGV